MSRRTVGLLVLLAAVPRLLVFPFAENVAGDAVVRAWMGHAFLEAPHLIGSSLQGCLQFGPLHFPLLALVEWLTGSLALAGRLLSLVVGVASVLPVFALAQRLFSERAAWWSALVFSVWSLHVQASTTAASEGLSGFFVLLGVATLARAFETGQRETLLGAGLVLTLAAAVRYDVWVWIALLSLVVWWRLGFVKAFVFGAVAGSFPMAWLVGHLVDTGDALYPLRVIDDYHRAWFVSEAQLWGRAYRVIVLGFWPLTAVTTFTPVGAVLGGWALLRAWRTPARWLVVLIVVPALFLSLRGALLGSFVPLSRFTMKELSLFALFVGAGCSALVERRRVLAPVLVVMLVTWLPLLEAAARAPWRWANSFRAVSALSVNPDDVRAVASWLRSELRADDVLAIDVDPTGFDDLQLAFESRLPKGKVARRRAPTFDAIAERGPRFVVHFEGGVLSPRGVEVFRAGRLRVLRP
ncbi:MAG: glycosyltransferase family 39 protein [Myxococcaceae bacterium]|nr:glycosyltransferase family 39 protein [Myxococcaceae bacterium]